MSSEKKASKASEKKAETVEALVPPVRTESERSSPDGHPVPLPRGEAPDGERSAGGLTFPPNAA